MKATIKVRFNDPDEFIAELRATQLYEPIVRLTKRFTQSKTLPIKYVSVVAGFFKQSGTVFQLVELTAQCGDYWPEQQPSKTLKRADELMDEVERKIKMLANQNIEIRAGTYELPE